jgi:CheY-like chemotaxis protein
VGRVNAWVGVGAGIMSRDQHTLLSQLLLSRGLVTEAVLAEALQTHETTGEHLGQVLVSMGAVGASELELALRAQARLRGRPDSSQPHILVVDDDPEVSAVLGEILSGAGYSAGLAEDASEAMAAATASDSTRPALMVLDLGLPGVSGLTFLAELRDRGYRLPVIVLAGSPDEDAHSRAKELEVLQVLAKPVSARALLEVVEAAIRSTAPTRT